MAENLKDVPLKHNVRFVWCGSEERGLLGSKAYVKKHLKELKKRTGMSSKQIAEKANLPEKTVIRILQGTTSDPRVDTVRRMVAAMGGSLDDIFAESGAIIGDQKLASLQEELYQVTVELFPNFHYSPMRQAIVLL